MCGDHACDAHRDCREALQEMPHEERNAEGVQGEIDFFSCFKLMIVYVPKPLPFVLYMGP